MQRRKFLGLSLTFTSTTSLLGFTLKASTQSKVDTPPGKGFIVKAGKDRFDEESLFGSENTLKCKVSSKDTDGTLYIVEQFDKDRSGPPLHIHPGQDEWFMVAEGAYLIKVGEEVFHLSKGDSAYGPKGVPHTFLPIGEGPHRMIVTFQPAGKMEAFFHNLKNPEYRERVKDVTQRFAEHDMKIVGPRLTENTI